MRFSLLLVNHEYSGHLSLFLRTASLEITGYNPREASLTPSLLLEGSLCLSLTNIFPKSLTKLTISLDYGTCLNPLGQFLSVAFNCSGPSCLFNCSCFQTLSFWEVSNCAVKCLHCLSVEYRNNPKFSDR